MNEMVIKLAEALVPLVGTATEGREHQPPNLQKEYRDFLSLCDGGYTRDHFFHFFGRKGPKSHDILEWNRIDLWKGYYVLDSSSFVFAENVFRFQYIFDIRADRKVVKMLNPDTGKVDLCANSFDDFIEGEIFSDEFNLDDRELANQFFSETGNDFQPYVHIACKKPLLLGGNTRDIANLELIDSLTNLSTTGQLVKQVRDLPPGTVINRITFRGSQT